MSKLWARTSWSNRGDYVLWRWFHIPNLQVWEVQYLERFEPTSIAYLQMWQWDDTMVLQLSCVWYTNGKRRIWRLWYDVNYIIYLRLNLWSRYQNQAVTTECNCFFVFWGGLTVLEREITQSGCLLLTGDSTFRIFHLICASKKTWKLMA